MQDTAVEVGVAMEDGHPVICQREAEPPVREVPEVREDMPASQEVSVLRHRVAEAGMEVSAEEDGAMVRRAVRMLAEPERAEERAAQMQHLVQQEAVVEVEALTAQLIFPSCFSAQPEGVEPEKPAPEAEEVLVDMGVELSMSPQRR